jgi:hypothetical protein
MEESVTPKAKKRGIGLDMRTFVGKDGRSYLVFRTGRGVYHVFMEVEAKAAARKCGATKAGTTHQMWDEVWKGDGENN